MSDSLFIDHVTLYNYQNRLGRTLGSKMHWEEETGIITQFLAKHKKPMYSDLLQALTYIYSLPDINFSLGSAFNDKTASMFVCRCYSLSFLAQNKLKYITKIYKDFLYTPTANPEKTKRLGGKEVKGLTDKEKSFERYVGSQVP